MMDDDAFSDWVRRSVVAISGIDPSFVPGPKTPSSEEFTLQAYISGVYILIRDDVPVYVGQSKNVFQRIAQHQAGASFEFDKFRVIPCDQSELLELEARLIRHFEPCENVMIPAYDDQPFKLNSTRLPKKSTKKETL